MRKLLLVPVLVTAMSSIAAQTAPGAGRAEIEAFNRTFADATRRMDNSALVALWSEDGVSLLPSMKPIVGRAAIASFIDGITSQMPGAKMEKFEMQCFAIEVSGDMGSEWCSEHQVVLLPGGKPPFDGHGRLLLVLHKGTDGKWRILREMWNASGES